MSISDVVKNINRRGGKRPNLSLYMYLGLLWASVICGLAGTLGLGFLWQKINTPTSIVIECSDEVLKGLQSTSTGYISMSNITASSSKSIKKRSKKIKKTTGVTSKN